MIGDHNQLPPVIKNVTFQKYSNMEQSLFTRFVKLGIPTVDLDAQGRARSSLCDLFRWRYKNLGDLVHVNARDEFQRANTGFVYDYQLINVEDFNGQGESEPQPYFYQNVAEAEYVVAVYMYMRMLGYAAESITILSTYNGQKHLIRDVLRKRCGKNQVFGFPKTVTTVDKYQGSQNDIILLSLVRTKSIGHLRDVRRLIVAMSRARLGLYVFARQKLFKSCFELTPVFNLLQKRSTKLELVIDETFPTRRGSDEQIPKEKVKIMQDMPEMTQFVFGFYQQKLNQWQKTSKNQQQSNQNDFNRQVSREERRRQLDEEEKVLRARLESTIENVQQTTQQKRLNINFDDDSSSSEEEESFEENNDQQQVEESENTAGEEKQKVDALAESSNDSQNQESD
jgi:intron-binding protein aquarius